MFLVFQLGVPALFDGPRQALFDSYQRLAPRHQAGSPVVIVAIDDATLRAEKLTWPWPRDVFARLMDRIGEAHPLVVGVDMVWTEPSKPDAAPDRVLGASIGKGLVAIGVEAVRGAGCGAGDADVGSFPPVLTSGPGGDETLAGLPCFSGVSRSVPAIDLAAAGHGVLSNDPDRDGVFRRVQLVSLLDGHPAPNLGLEMYRLAAKAPFLTVFRDGRLVRGVGVGATTIPTEPNGGLRVDFSPRREWSVCSAWTLLEGPVCKDAADGRPVSLDGKLVLVGLTGAGLADQQRQTPLEAMPGVEIQAQGLENLLEGQLARRPGWSLSAEAAAMLLLGGFLILFLPGARRVSRIAASVAPFGILLVVGVGLWAGFRLLADVATPAIGCAFVMVSMLGGGLVEADAQRRRLRRELDLQRLAAARAEGELEAGRRIQMGILPAPESLGVDARFDLAALMTPARQIGGDLYDFFKIDQDHLFIAVGDVSGKGLPASLFMALGKSLCKSCALRGETDIGAIVRRADAEISRDNPEMLFITLFAGILDLETGELLFCNAGHDAPILVRPGEAPRDVSGDGGPPLCVVDDFPYKTEVCRLKPRDLLCVTTDGVTEAMTAEGVLMGREPLDRVLADLPPDASARMVIEGIQETVEAFVAGADPSDDLTVLTVRWLGPTGR